MGSSVEITPKATWKILLSGAIAGATAKTAIAPFDRVKIHFQVKNPSLAPFIGTYSGVFKAVHRIYVKDGFFGLYRGHLATIVRIMPYAAINFTTFDRLKGLFGLKQSSGEKALAYSLKKILAGSLSGCAAVTATYPFDILRARIAYSTLFNEKSLFPEHHYLTSYRSVIRTLLNEGRGKFGLAFAGFYQGYLPTIMGIIPYAGTSFFTYETLKARYLEHYGNDKTDSIPAIPKFLCGMLAGIAAQTAAYPLDVIRRRSQLWRIAGHLPPSDTFSFRDTFGLLKELVKSRGWRELFVGLTINYLKVAPAMGISFAVFEFCQENLF